MMEKQIKYFIYILILVWMTIYHANTIINIKAAKRNIINTIETQHQKRLTLDSLYIEHLKQCSFIPNDHVFTDKWGHLRVKITE